MIEMYMTAKKTVRIALVTAVTAFSTVSNAADLEIRISNIKSDAGTLKVALWETPADFLSEADPAKAQTLQAKSGDLNLTFTDLKSGTYAVSLYHDENKNGELDSNLFHIPTEGYGFSNDAAGTFGPPSFQDAAFQIANEDVQVNILINY